MYGICANIWGILMVNVTIYSIHGSYGIACHLTTSLTMPLFCSRSSKNERISCVSRCKIATFPRSKSVTSRRSSWKAPSFKMSHAVNGRHRLIRLSLFTSATPCHSASCAPEAPVIAICSHLLCSSGLSAKEAIQLLHQLGWPSSNILHPILVFILPAMGNKSNGE